MERRFRLVQLEPTLGNVEANLAMHREAAERALADGVEGVLFPELSLTGYFLKDQTPEVATTLDAPAFDGLRELSRRISIGLGFVERARDGRIYNAWALLEDGEVRHVHRKVHLVTYGMFEESRDFAAGEQFRAFDSKLGRLGVLTCEDVWHSPGAWLYFLQGADALIVPSAGPARGVGAEHDGLGSVESWRLLLRSTAFLSQCWLLYANRVGCEDGICFGGHSMVVDPFGHERARLESLDAGELDATLDPADAARARAITPLRRDEKAWIVRRELERLEDEEG